MSGNFLSPSKRGKGGQTMPGRITYRHLLTSQAMTPSNPLRVIALVDIDAAYAQFEMVRLKLPEDKPVCVQQWSGLIAVNYPARKFGITRHMNVEEARKVCPDLIAVHVATYREGDKEPSYHPAEEAKPTTHKVSLDPYRRESAKILAVFKEMISDGEVEKASIDEAFFDITALTIREILVRFPYLAAPPADAPAGMDTELPPPPPISWVAAGNVFPIRGETNAEHKGKPQLEDGREDGDGHDAEDSDDEHGREGRPGVGGWEDMALCIGAEIMSNIRKTVHTRLGYTCSAGVAHNKTLAKLCAGWKKPNAQTILRQAAIPAFLNPLPFTKIRNLGGKLGDAMAKEYEASTVGDMLSVSLEDMQKKFGEDSIWVYNILRGIDYSLVTERTNTKSMLASKNVQPMVTTRDGGRHWLKVLAGELYVRLRDARELQEGLWPKTLVLGTRQPYESSRSRQTNFPFARNLSTEYITKYAFKLWDEVTEPMTRQGSSKSTQMKFTNLALSFNGLERLEGGQKGIEGFFAGGAGPSVMPTHKRERSASAGPSNTKDQPLLKRRRTDEDADEKNGVVGDDADIEAKMESDGVMMWTCPRCKKVLQVDTGQDDDIVMTTAEGAVGLDLLEAVRQEHEDMHFAQDLHRQDRAGNIQAGGSGKSSTVKKKVKKPKGIAAFFTPKPGGA